MDAEGSTPQKQLPSFKDKELQFGEQIGAGGFATVKKAKTSEGNTVAVKHIRDRHCLENFQKEAKCMQRLKHRHIIDLLGYLVNDKNYIIGLVMPLLRQGDLRRYLSSVKSDRKFDLKLLVQKVRWICGIASAVAYLHSQRPKILHLDVNPANVLITDEKEAVLTDFGLSRSKLKYSEGKSDLTSDIHSGTYLYMPPEYLENLQKATTTKFDAYGFSATLYFTLTEKNPYNDKSQHQIVNIAKSGENLYSHITSTNFSDGCPREIVEALIAIGACCCHIDPDVRPEFTEISDNCRQLLAKINTNTCHIMDSNDTTNRSLTTQDTDGCVKCLSAHFQHAMKKLNISPKTKITWQNAVTYSSSDHCELYMKIIKRLLMLNSKARDEIGTIRSEVEDHVSGEDHIFDFDVPNTSDKNDGNALNPLDVFLLVFSCCDNILRQVLAAKMFTCKLAIPFIFPEGSYQCFVMSYWALRKICLEWTQNEYEIDFPVTSKPTSVISFVRIGKPNISKSKLMNCILNDSGYDAFFNEDCPNAAVPRKIAFGVVECTWFVPSGKQEDILVKPCLFLNLRGSAHLHRRQCDLLTQVSSTVAVLVNIQDLVDISYLRIVEEICRGSRHVTLVLAKNSTSHLDLTHVKHRLDKRDKDKVKVVTTYDKMRIKSKRDLKKEICNTFPKFIEEIDMQSIVEFAKSHNISIDEEDQLCLKGKQIAGHVMEHLKSDSSTVNCTILPLQTVLWPVRSKLLANRHQNVFELEEQRELDSHILDNNNKMIHACKQMPNFMEQFILALEQCDKLEPGRAVSIYFLQWMHLMLLDESRKRQPKTKQKYTELWTEYQKIKGQGNDHETKLKEKLEKAEKEYEDSTLSTHDIFREAGQIYDVITRNNINLTGSIKSAVASLPNIMAKLMADNVTLEILDREVSSLPTYWTRAIFDRLETFTKGQNILAITTLGVQSSGKSTLLNTMFGLDFAVSAGRCTKSTHIHLINVDKESGLPFNYIFVIDTEGIRAPEKSHSTYQHDNEMATLIMGLGDITMFNIRGQDLSEIENVLQIAVHAFVRMKIVHKNMRIHQSCVFVHQNVGALDAKPKMQHGLQKFQEKLDDMTKDVAEKQSKDVAEEQRQRNIRTFSQIIKFSVDDGVMFISDLWQGDLPMAPANPGYSERVELAKTHIIEHIGRNQKSVLTVKEFFMHFHDLWNGVMADKFVFGFRNSLEIKAYNSMQEIYFSLLWDLEKYMTEWLHINADKEIKSCDGVNALRACFSRMIKEVCEKVTAKERTLKNKLEYFFNHNNLEHITRQWERERMEAFGKAVEQRIHSCEMHLEAITNNQNVDICTVEKTKEVRKQIIDFAKNTGQECKYIDLSKEGLKRLFHGKMKVLRESLEYTHNASSDINSKVYDVLIKKLVERGIVEIALWKQMRCTPFIQRNKFQINTVTYHPPFDRKSADASNEIIKEVNKYLLPLAVGDEMFMERHATEMVAILTKLLDNFPFSNEIKMELVFHICAQANSVFENVKEKYNEKRGITKHLEKTLETLFIHTVQKTNQEAMAANMLYEALFDLVQTEVAARMVTHVQDFIISDKGIVLKFHLILQIMEDLASKNEFSSFLAYIDDAKKFSQEWLKQFVDTSMFKSKPSIYASRSSEEIDNIVRKIKQCVAEAARNCSLKGSDIHDWVTEFISHVRNDSVVAIPGILVKQLTYCNITDFKSFNIQAQKQLDMLKNKLRETFERHTKDDFDCIIPYVNIFNRLWGCPESCPFCNEPCTDTVVGHFKTFQTPHRCLQHRPLGITGTQWSAKTKPKDLVGQLNINICNYSVQTDVTFNCKSCRNECKKHNKCSATEEVYHVFREYKTFIPEWDIPPNTMNDKSKYWMKFMACNITKLCAYHKAEKTFIPEQWYSIRDEEATEEAWELAGRKKNIENHK